MTVLANIKAVLEADGTLLATATGGIYDFDETERLGINRTTLPGAFDANLIIKPCVLVKLRSEVPDDVLADDPSQYVSLTAIYEFWCYEDNGFTNIDTMLARIYTLMQGVQVSGTFQMHWMGDATPFRDDVLDANLNRSDYMATVKRSA